MVQLGISGCVKKPLQLTDSAPLVVRIRDITHAADSIQDPGYWQPADVDTGRLAYVRPEEFGLVEPHKDVRLTEV